jgi:4-hydroxyacetophenone monooxygenase
MAPSAESIDRAALRDAIEATEIAALLPAVAHVTGDHSILRDEFRPTMELSFEPQQGVPPAMCTAAFDVAEQALVDWSAAGRPPAPPPTREDLDLLLAFVVGAENIEPYRQLLLEELGLDGDLRAPAWSKQEVAPDRPFRVGIIGAGMSGLVAAHRLRQVGVEVVVLEKDEDVGGTWLENTYPGCRVDVPSHLYSYTFAPGTWTHRWSTQPDLLAYFRRCADELDLRSSIRFGTEVVEATWSDDDATWTVRTRGVDGVEGEERVQALVSAVGQLNRPHIPLIPGAADFEGPVFHSARWDHDVDLAGKRVVVIGTGASALQFVPEIAPRVEQLTVFQRTPPWLLPAEEYHSEVPDLDALRALAPVYDNWYRLYLFWRMHEGLLIAATVDTDWVPPEPGCSVGPVNEFVRQFLAMYLREQFASRPDLVDKVVPAYPPVAKRMLVDNGSWARALMSPNVDLVTEPIERITAKGVMTTDGVEHLADVLIWGTGFTASDFLMPMKVVGRDGVELHEMWKGDARAYLGVSVPGFPNLFMMYGPNTNIVINGSIIYFSELETRYLVDAIRSLLASGRSSVDVRRDVHDEFNVDVDAANSLMAWGASDVNSWYKNRVGRVAQNWPFSLLDYWHRTQAFDQDLYEVR